MPKVLGSDLTTTEPLAIGVPGPAKLRANWRNNASMQIVNLSSFHYGIQFQCGSKR